ncbi:MAG: M12 family metallo-peptidase [Hydrogenophaga sp.]
MNAISSLFHRIHFRRSMGWLLCSASLWGLATAQAQRVPRVEHPPKPQLQLQVDRAQGENAIRLLGDRLPEVAKAHGMTAQALEKMLLGDQSLWIDRHGRLLYVDPVPAIQPGQSPQPSTAPRSSSGAVGARVLQTSALNYTSADAFLLNSKPDAKKIIYLDFTGHVVTGTAWNNTYGSTISSPAFSLDSDRSQFSTAEKEAILDIWRRVAEDYAPFDVNVTTVEPSMDALVRSSISDEEYGSRVVIAPDFTRNPANPCRCGGFAYVGVYSDINNLYYQPAYVFQDQLGNNNKNIAEAISHEAGHNLGLSHDGTSSTGYYSGHGDGDTGWAPIMGVGYSKNLVQWSKGEYPGANQTQDDLVVIQQNGAPIRADDHGNVTANATSMQASPTADGQSLFANGVIETRDDVDVFKINLGNGGGSIQLTLTGATPSSNLDAQLKLMSADSTFLITDNAVGKLGASVSATNLPAGDYYVIVDGVGRSDISPGYSDYGSLGQYTISGSASAPTGFPPVVSLSASHVQGYAKELSVKFSGSATDPDGTVTGFLLDAGNGQTSAQSSSTFTDTTVEYLSAGSYTARLVATDNDGVSGQSSLLITVFAPRMDVSNVSPILFSTVNKQKIGNTTVTVKDGKGAVVSGVTVYGRWSGAVSSSLSAVTNVNGVATFTSPAIKTTKSVRFDVTNIARTGFTYDPALLTAPTFVTSP